MDESDIVSSQKTTNYIIDIITNDRDVSNRKEGITLAKWVSRNVVLK